MKILQPAGCGAVGPLMIYTANLFLNFRVRAAARRCTDYEECVRSAVDDLVGPADTSFRDFWWVAAYIYRYVTLTPDLRVGFILQE